MPDVCGADRTTKQGHPSEVPHVYRVRQESGGEKDGRIAEGHHVYIKRIVSGRELVKSGMIEIKAVYGEKITKLSFVSVVFGCARLLGGSGLFRTQL